MERAEKSLNTQEVERLLRSRLDEIQGRIAELAKAPEPGFAIGFGKRIGDGISEAISIRERGRRSIIATQSLRIR